MMKNESLNPATPPRQDAASQGKDTQSRADALRVGTWQLGSLPLSRWL
jgi:hypothetical protein